MKKKQMIFRDGQDFYIWHVGFFYSEAKHYRAAAFGQSEYPATPFRGWHGVAGYF